LNTLSELIGLSPAIAPELTKLESLILSLITGNGSYGK